MPHDNIELIKRFAREINASPRNLGEVRKMLHPNVLVREAPALPYGGDHHGVDGFVHVVDSVDRYWTFIDGTESFEPSYVEVGPDTVLMRVEADVVATDTGNPLRMRVAEFFTVRDGMIVEVDVYYWDTASMCRALSP